MYLQFTVLPLISYDWQFSISFQNMTFLVTESEKSSTVKSANNATPVVMLEKLKLDKDSAECAAEMTGRTLRARKRTRSGAMKESSMSPEPEDLPEEEEEEEEEPPKTPPPPPPIFISRDESEEEEEGDEEEEEEEATVGMYDRDMIHSSMLKVCVCCRCYH